MKLINHINNAVRIATQKTGASLRLGAAITGDVVGSAVHVVGGTTAVVGAGVAATGFAIYSGGRYVMQKGERLSNASQEMAGKAYDELVGRRAEQHLAPEPPVEFQPQLA